MRKSNRGKHNGSGGLSLFVDIKSALSALPAFTDQDITIAHIDTSSPHGGVKAYYTYIKTRDLSKAFRLLSDEKRDVTPYSEWIAGYKDTLFVEPIKLQVDKANKNKMNLKITSGDWVDGELVRKYFEGYWIVDKELKLHESNISEVKDPDWEWFYGQAE